MTNLMILRNPKRPRDAYKLTNHPYTIHPFPASQYRLKAKELLEIDGDFVVRFAHGYGYKRYKTELIPVFWDRDVGNALISWIKERGGGGKVFGSKFVAQKSEDALLVYMAFV